MQKTKSLIASFVLVISLGFVGTAAAADSHLFTQGDSYESVAPAQPTEVKPGQIEVIEFFWYGCPHCFRLDPYVEQWLKTKPKNVVFRRIPVAQPWGEHMDIDAYAFYTAKALGLEPKIHVPLFDAIHRNRQRELARDKNALQAFFKGYGVSKADFDATWNSFSVNYEIKKAVAIEKTYGLTGVPTLIVNGKWKTGADYRTRNGGYLSPRQIMQTVEKLVKMEEAGIKK